MVPRLHNPREFDGMNASLVHVKHLAPRPRDHVRSEGAVGRGATVCFALRATTG